MNRLRVRLGQSVTTAAIVLAGASACVPDSGREDRTAGDYLRILAAEDARPIEGVELALLAASIDAREPLLRRTAVRALGRLERPELQNEISAALDDPSPSVRAAAGLALAQSVHGVDGGPVLGALLARVPRESDPAVRGALAWALGRLTLRSAERERALEAILGLGLGPSEGSSGGGGEAPPEALVGVALGLEALVGGDGQEGVSLPAASRLTELLSYRRDAVGDVDAARVRALAVTSLGAARRMTVDLLLTALDDPDAEVRRLAIRELDAVVPSRRHDLLRRALRDSSDRVQIEAIRFLAGGARTEVTCEMLVTAARPSSPTTVRIEALAALAAPCPGSGQSAVLRETAGALDAEGGAWHTAAQALRSLARIDPTATRRLLPRFAGHSDPFVRAHAAQAAATLRERQTLGTLGVDESANVRTAAIQGLFALQGHAIDALLRAHLESSDPQLLLTTARLLEGSPERGASATAALDAFERVSEARRETWRDPRRALLERVAGLGDASLAERLRPYLHDYDPVVAADVALVLTGWTGEAHLAAPAQGPRARGPSVEELAALERTTVILHMRGLGRIVIQPLPHTALSNVYRFVRLAEAGYYDGLTFHRRAANFVIQGGSPGANEYAGDGPYTRDEIGDVAHWRGTVGVSTRGRDTGDGQIFINLTHNVRLDPDYTVMGVVVEGMDVVDRVLEGAVIDRAEVRIAD